MADNRLPEATAALEALVERNPAGVVAKQRLLRLGNLLLLQGRVGDAADRLNAAIAGDPDPRPCVDDWGRAEGARTLLIAATGLAGHAAEARAMYANFDRLWPHRSTWRLAGTATRSMSSLPGFRRMLAALEAAGMPRYADEHADDHVPPGSLLPADNAFAPAPITLPGTETIDTATFVTRLRLKRDLPGRVKCCRREVETHVGDANVQQSGRHRLFQPPGSDRHFLFFRGAGRSLAPKPRTVFRAAAVSSDLARER